MNSQKIRILLKAFDHKILDHAAKEIVNAVKRTGAHISGPIPLPNNTEHYTVNRSPHIDKKSREQFKICTRRRVLYIKEANTDTVTGLNKVDLAAGVDVEIKILGDK